mgnify:CR=1 FL=1
MERTLHTILLFSFLIIFGKLQAQQSDELVDYEYFESDYLETAPINIFEFGVKYILPQGAFKRYRNGRNFGGANISFLRQLKGDSPFFIKGNFDFAVQDSYSSPVKRIVNFFEEDWDAQTVSYVLTFGIGVRYYPPMLGFWRIDPFVELNSGFNWFLTSTYFSRLGGDETESIIEGGQLAYYLGSSAGFNVKISDAFFLLIKISYNQGLAADYYVRNDVAQAFFSSFEAFDKRRSATDMLNFCLGISYAF